MRALNKNYLNLQKFCRKKKFCMKKSVFGILSKYADKNLISQEKSDWESEVAKKTWEKF